MHTNVDDKLRNLEQRMRRMEQRTEHRSLVIPFRSQEDRARVVGWALLVCSLLGLTTSSATALPGLALAFVGVLIVSLWLILSASGLIEKSDSRIIIEREMHAGRKVHAHAIHHTVHGSKRRWPRMSSAHLALAIGFFCLAGLLGWSLVQVFNDPVYQVVPLGALLTIWGLLGIQTKRPISIFGAVIALVLLYITLPSPVVALVSALISFVLLWVYGWNRRIDFSAEAIGLGLLATTYGQVLMGSARFDIPERVAAVGIAILGIILCGLPYAISRRMAEHRDASRVILLAAPLLATCIFTAIGPNNQLTNLEVILLLVSICYAGLGYVAWLSFDRLSYAKYFLAVGLGAFMLFDYLFLDPTTVALAWYVASIVVLVTGFLLPSYTARLLGLGLMVVAVLHYMLTIVPMDTVPGPILLQDRVWLGLVIALFLPVLALWYKQVANRGSEHLLVPAVVGGLSATSFVILFGIAYLDLPPIAQSTSWLLLGILAFWYGSRMIIPIIEKAGLILGGIALAKLIAFDAFALSLSDRVVLYLTLAIVLILAGAGLVKRSN